MYLLRTCLVVFRVLGTTAFLPLNRDTVNWREVRPFLWCEWVQKALNTTELPQAHIDFLAERRLLGGGAGKDNRKAGGFLDSPSRPLQHKSIIGERKKNNTSPPKGARLRHWAAPTEGGFSCTVRVQDKCLTYLWIVEKRSVCAALTNDERRKALTSPLTVSSATHQEQNSLHKCTFTWLFHSLRLSGCVPKHTIIVFCCLYRSKNTYSCEGLSRCQRKCGILYPPNQRNHISLIQPQELDLCESYFTSLLKGTSLTKPKLTLFVETSVQQSGLEDFFLGLIELQFLDNFRKANGLQVPPRNVQRCWRPRVGFHLITYHYMITSAKYYTPPPPLWPFKFTGHFIKQNI